MLKSEIGVLFSNKLFQTVNKHKKYCVTNYLNIGLCKLIIEAVKIYKPEACKSYTKVEIFKVKFKNKNLNSQIRVLLSNKLF
jgi:hypothetical protein